MRIYTHGLWCNLLATKEIHAQGLVKLNPLFSKHASIVWFVPPSSKPRFKHLTTYYAHSLRFRSRTSYKVTLHLTCSM